LTDKAQVVIVNSPQGQSLPDTLRALAPEALAIDAKLELELAQLEPDERAVFMADMGVTELGRDRIIRKAYEAVGIITFFTAGEPEARGWTLRRGQTALEAAAAIHTDIARGFIRAEVVRWNDLVELGSYAEVARRGLQQLEGKTYEVQDGDVLTVRFNV